MGQGLSASAASATKDSAGTFFIPSETFADILVRKVIGVHKIGVVVFIIN